MIDVLRAGPLTTVQDLGRPGWAHLGVPRSGALDPPALRLANRIVGNPDGAAGLEVTLTGCRLRPHEAATVAVTGARARVHVAGEEVPFAAPVRVPAGTTMDVGRTLAGVRTYIAVAGGIDVPAVLGSRSTDTLSGIGPPRISDGACLPIGRACGSRSSERSQPVEPAEVVLRVRVGPRADWFTAEAVDTLLLSSYEVSPMSNRVGARLAGPGLRRARAGELPSEGVVLGAVQVPASGEPLVFLADHPTTGGYPVIAVVDEADLPALAQARPGTTVRFHGPQR
jgi:biotin-dependent carboxylase-like uncharacterized protein